MKILYFLCFFLPVAGSAGLTAADGRRVIENHSFGIFTAEGGVVVSLQNEDCVGRYRVASGKTVISEGSIDFRLLPVINIPFGEKDLQVACTAGNRLGVDIR